jgi:proteic killer suppression protein
MAIRSFADNDTEAFWRGNRVGRFQSFESVATRKIAMLNAAVNLSSLARVPGNRLELLKGDRAGEHSIRINDHWRICFKWRDADAYNVEINNHYK